MAEYTEQYQFIVSINTENKCISIDRFTIGLVDGNQVNKSLPHTCAFVPGDIEAVKSYLQVTDSPEITYLESLWTPEAITNYQAMIAAQEAALLAQ